MMKLGLTHQNSMNNFKDNPSLDSEKSKRFFKSPSRIFNKSTSKNYCTATSLRMSGLNCRKSSKKLLKDVGTKKDSMNSITEEMPLNTESNQNHYSGFRSHVRMPNIDSAKKIKVDIVRNST